MKTTDNKSYYRRTGDAKSKIVFDIIKNKWENGNVVEVLEVL